MATTFSTIATLSVVGSDVTLDSQPFINYVQKMALSTSPDGVYQQRFTMQPTGIGGAIGLPLAPSGSNYMVLKLAVTSDVNQSPSLYAATNIYLLTSISQQLATPRVPAGGLLILPVVALGTTAGSINSGTLTQVTTFDLLYF